MMDYIKKHYNYDALFIDEEFPPLSCSLGTSILQKSKELDVPIIWKRPKDIIADPQFIIDGLNADDINIGPHKLINDVWFVFALQSLVSRGVLGEDWTSADQGFDNVRYTGAFEFTFFKQGKFRSVIIDDFLPTLDGQLLGIHSSNHREFWSALMEKAYAKINGTYSEISDKKAVDVFLEISGFFPLKISILDLNPNKLALCIDQGVLVNTGCTGLQLKREYLADQSVKDYEDSFHSSRRSSVKHHQSSSSGLGLNPNEYLNFNFSILKYERDYNDILGDEILFEISNPKIKPGMGTVYESVNSVMNFVPKKDDADSNPVGGMAKKTFSELRTLFPSLIFIFDVYVWKPVLRNFSPEKATPLIWPLMPNACLEDIEGHYLEFQKRNRSHILTQIMATENSKVENMSVSFGIYKVSNPEDSDYLTKPLTKLFEFSPKPRSFTRYLEIPQGHYVIVFYSGSPEFSKEDISFSVYEEDILESIQRRKKLHSANIESMQDKDTVNFIHTCFDD